MTPSKKRERVKKPIRAWAVIDRQTKQVKSSGAHFAVYFDRAYAYSVATCGQNGDEAVIEVEIRPKRKRK